MRASDYDELLRSALASPGPIIANCACGRCDRPLGVVHRPGTVLLWVPTADGAVPSSETGAGGPVLLTVPMYERPYVPRTAVAVCPTHGMLELDEAEVRAIPSAYARLPLTLLL